MNPLEVIVALMLNASMPCIAGDATYKLWGADRMLVTPYGCGDRFFEVWYKTCPVNNRTRAFAIIETNSHIVLYVDKVGDTLLAGGVLEPSDVNRPQCGT